jgi:hypothetical protein
MIRLIVSLIAAAVTILADQAHAQGALQAPLPPPSSELADACHKRFAALRDEAERRGRLVKAASDRRAPRDEACQRIGSFSEAELKMIRYVDANSAKCGLQQVAARLRAGHAKTEEMRRRLCAVPGV